MSRTAHIQLCQAQGKGGDKLRLRSWVEVQLVGEDDKPIAGESYELTLPGGSVVSGTLGDSGTIRIDDIPPGVCVVSFPKLDQEAWTTYDNAAR
jgi:hypothetical protein